MSAKTKARSSGKYQGQQSDDDFQRHNANRQHREQSGQDHFGQKAFVDAELYTIVDQKTQGDEHYYRLRCGRHYGPRDGQWVRAKEVRVVYR